LCVGCPDTVVITPTGITYTAGDELTCSSDGYPAATYVWTVDDVMDSTASTQTLQEGAHEYVCTATVDLGGVETCADNATVSVTAYSKY